MNPFLARFDCEPSLVSPEMMARFESCLAAVAGSEHARDFMGSFGANDDGFWSDEPTSWKAALRPYVVRDGVLQIPVKGVLLNDFPYAFGSYATGYVYIRRALERGLGDGSVRGIAFVCDSPGGMVAGNFDLADRIHAARGVKPMRAFAHEAAYSAAYSIASSADQIVVSRSGGVGSIGVVTMHRDVSKALAEAGIKITLIFAGDHKVDGNSFEPLPPAVRDRFKARVETTYAEFVAIVARNRGLSDEAVRATQALTYSAKDAIAVGLADTIGSLDDAVAEFTTSLIPEDEDEDNMIDQATHDAAIAKARQEGADEASTRARGEGEAAAKARTKAILSSEHAEGRGKLANHLAFETDLPADQAVALLQNAERAKPEGSRLDAAMRDPDVSGAPETGTIENPAGAALAGAVDRMVAGMKPAS